MEISRRTFLGGAIAISACAVLPIAAVSQLPEIVGDGAHDDTAGLQALFNRLPVIMDGKLIEVSPDGVILFNDGTFRTTSTLVINKGPLSINGGTFVAEHDECTFDVREHGSQLSFANMKMFHTGNYKSANHFEVESHENEVALSFHFLSKCPT